MKAMKLWRAANAYWVFLLGVIIYLIERHSFSDSGINPVVAHALAYVLVVAVFLFIAEFQFAWFYYLRGKEKDHKKK